ncbi:unnamed protein product [Adineta ricciae]|uniref:phosphatidate phosphatase n=1 Tax=Adineta ricciae TaxID=249248 RepID=A0A813Y6P0_ADIRI|nr:unnamed protein product [Adineta ricciae]CAF1175921.1 unnamed protein product [Adineta ricciae]
MTSITRKLFSTLTTAYRNINPSTLNGAIDIIVVKQEDGTFRCTPFHVRFGKLGVLQSLQNKVYININDVPVEDIFMQLGEAGEAVFIEEQTNTPVIAPTRHLELSDSNNFLDPDNSVSLDPDANVHKHLSNIDCSPQIINKELDEIKANETDQSRGKYAYDEDTKPTINIDVLHSNTIISARRRHKRRLLNRSGQFIRQISEDDEQDIFQQFSSLKRRARARKRDSTPVTAGVTTDSDLSTNKDARLRSSITLLRKRSASENDVPLFQFDFEPNPSVDVPSRLNSIDSRPKTLNLNGINKECSMNEDNSTDNDGNVLRTLSDPIIIDQTQEPIITTNESTDALDSSVLSQSAPLEGVNTNTIRVSQSDEHSNDFYTHADYSPTSSYQSALSPRPTSPKSDTEYELEKSSQASPNVGWQWKWGELPEQRRSVFRYLWPSSKKLTPQEGMYLDDITNNRCADRSLYLPRLEHHQHQQRAGNDDDQESGTGNSIPQSPFREHETSCLLGDAQLSLCGNLNKSTAITDEMFTADLVSYETFANNPSIINDPNLVVRINGKYYNWNVASALITATSIFHKPLPVEAIEQLQDKHMKQEKPRATGSGWWLPFYSKKPDLKIEAAKVTTPVTAADTIPTVAKSEIIQSTTTRPESLDTPKSEILAPTLLRPETLPNLKPDKNSKSDNDSEQEDSEVQKLTAKMEEAKVQIRPHSSSTHSTQQTTLRKTMILSSDQLKRLNLKLGKNKVEFSVTTALQGTTTVESNIFLFDHMTKFVISDIDGTITKSDVLGHVIPLVGGDWSHDGIAEFFNAIQENGYQFIYLSARAIGQSQITRNFLRNIKQSDRELPSGPLLISPDTLLAALYREVIAKKPEDFKIECLKNIASLYPGKNPFYAGFGNRINDQWAYTAVGIPVTRIYTINSRGEVVREKLSKALLTSYKNLHEIVDLLFPPMDSFHASENYSDYTYWHKEPAVESFEDQMRADLEEISKRQKPNKSNAKNKTTTTSAASTPTTTSPSKATPTTTVLKPSGDKLLTIAQVTENNVKRA